MIAVESATVYRGGGRRWFSLRSACRAEARQKIAARKPDCGCDYCDHPEMPGAGREDLPCYLHGQGYATAYRRLARLYLAAAKRLPPPEA